MRNGRLYNLVRWVGLTKDFDTWVPTEALANHELMDNQIQDELVNNNQHQIEIYQENGLNDAHSETEQDHEESDDEQPRSGIINRPQRTTAGKRSHLRFIEEQEQEEPPQRRRNNNQQQENTTNNKTVIPHRIIEQPPRDPSPEQIPEVNRVIPETNIQNRSRRTTAGKRLTKRFIEQQEDDEY